MLVGCNQQLQARNLARSLSRRLHQRRGGMWDAMVRDQVDESTLVRHHNPTWWPLHTLFTLLFSLFLFAAADGTARRTQTTLTHTGSITPPPPAHNARTTPTWHQQHQHQHRRRQQTRAKHGSRAQRWQH